MDDLEVEVGVHEDEDDRKLCRLCGLLYTSRMIVDLFSDYSVERELVSKIETRLAVLIDESDVLPKVICIQCLGKLEFVCDFQEECLQTQNVLHDQYNQPSLNVGKQKPEDSLPSTSASASTNNIINLIQNAEIIISNEPTVENCALNNNNTFDKNLNPPIIAEIEVTSSPSKTLSRETLAARTLVKNESCDVQIENPENVLDIQQLEVAASTPNAKSSRRLRSRQSTESSDVDTSVPKAAAKRASTRKKRLTSHNNNNNNSSNLLDTTNENQNAPDTAADSSQTNKISISSNTLNKLLKAIVNDPIIGVSIKEPTDRTNDAEDVSYVVELSKTKSNSSCKVQVKVFPKQGTCLADESIIAFLQQDTIKEVSCLVSSIVDSASNTSSASAATAADASLIDNLQNVQDVANSSLNPEELFKMDGKEISVDDKVEHCNSNGQTTYVCKLCRKVYERKDKCTVHVKTHLGIKQYVCVLCLAKFVCKSDVMKHIRCSHTNPRPIACPKCPKRFRSKFDLTEHMNVHKGVKPYQCADCDQSYHHKVSLQMHVKSHMPPQNLACEYCSKIFPYRTRLLSHIGSVHMKDKRNFRCRFCYNLYSSLAVLNEHIKTRHTKTYTCETCGKTFKVSSKYKTHVLQHSNPKPFVCGICKNRYASKAFLNEHVLKHQGVRRHVCQKCGASFAQASHLAAHRHVHEEKSYACPECGKLFNRRDNMKVHRKRHFTSSGASGTASGKKKNAAERKKVSNDENAIDNENEN